MSKKDTSVKDWKERLILELDEREREYLDWFIQQEIDRAREEGRENGVSNCCGAEVYPHNANDNTSRCTECKEGCTVVYF